MAIRVNETRRNPTTGRVEKTGRQLRPVYSRRSGGGYEVKESPANEPIPKDSLSADKSLNKAQAEQAARDQLNEQKEQQKADQKAKEDLKAAQTVTRQLNESAQRTGSPNRYALTGDEQGNVYISKTTSQPNVAPESTNDSRRNSTRSALPQTQDSQPKTQSPKSVPVPGTSAGSSGGNPSDPLSGFQKRIERIEAYESRVNARSQQRENFFRSIPGLRGDNFVQRTARSAIQIPGVLFIETPERIAIASQKAFATGEALLRKDTRSPAITESTRAAGETPALVARANDPRTPEGLVNVLFAAAGIRGSRAPKAPKVEVVTTRSRTIEADLPGGKSFDLTEGQFTVKAGKREFTAETTTAATTKPDAQGTFIRTEKTQIAITEAKTRRTYTGTARADVQIKATGRGSRARGTQTQVTNVSPRKGIQESGRTAARTRNINEDVSITRSATETSKGTKVKPVKDPELVQYPAELGKRTSAQIAQAKSRKLVETQTPLYPKIAEAAGVEVRGVTQPVRQTLSESRGAAVSGSRVLKAAETRRTQTGITVRQTESGKTIVDVGAPARVTPTPPRRVETTPPPATSTVTESILSVPKTNPTPRTQTQVQAAVTRIVAADSKAIPVVVQSPRLAPSQTRTEARTQPQTQSRQEPPVQTSSTRQRQESALAITQKPRQEALSDLGQALSPARRTRENSRQNQRPELAVQSAQRQEQQQEPIVIPALESAQKQLTKQTNLQRGFNPQARQGLKLPAVIPFKRSTKSEDGYAVFVRRGGKFGQVSTTPLTRGAALKLGAQTARNTAARSFKIEKVSGKAKGKTTTADLKDFYRSRKERGVFIQKSETSIKTPGEFREITAKGIRASRGRR